MKHRVLFAVSALCVVILTSACSPTEIRGGEEIIDSDTYVELYRETVASFPEQMPAGIEFPASPPPMNGDIGIGNAGAKAYFYWSCAWEDVYLTSSDDQARAEAMTQLRAFPTTEWALKHYEDPDGFWDGVLDAAELGDLTQLREVFDSDCVTYRSAQR